MACGVDRLEDLRQSTLIVDEKSCIALEETMELRTGGPEAKVVV